MDGTVFYYRRAEEMWDSPAAVQIPVAMLFFHALDQKGISDYDTYIHSDGLQGRTFQQLLEAILVDSEDAATQALAWWIGEQLDGDAVLQSWELHHTTLKPYRSTAWDVATAIEGLYNGRLVSDDARALILEFTSESASVDDAGTGVLSKYLEDGSAYQQVVVDNSLPVVAYTAIVEVSQESYILVVYGGPARYGEKETTSNALERATEEVTLAFLNSYLAR